MSFCWNSTSFFLNILIYVHWQRESFHWSATKWSGCSPWCKIWHQERIFHCVTLREPMIHFFVTGFALFATRDESIGGIMSRSDSLYFMCACWVQDGISNPLIVVLVCVWPINVFLPFMQTTGPSSYRGCSGAAVISSAGHWVSVFVF